MSLPVLPPQLPRPLAGASFDVDGVMERMQVETGAWLQWRLGVAEDTRIQVAWRLTDERYLELREFLDVTTEGGTQWFVMPLHFGEGYVDTVVRLASDYDVQATPSESMEWSVQLVLELRDSHVLPQNVVDDYVEDFLIVESETFPALTNAVDELWHYVNFTLPLEQPWTPLNV